MARETSLFASQLRIELGARNRLYARGRAHVESYGNPPVIVYAPDETRHGNFFEAAYAAILARPEWLRRFDKIHAQARSLPKVERKWRELDSSMSSDALLMNVFCTPSVTDSPAVRNLLGIDSDEMPDFGWKARVPLANGRFDRTEVDMRWGELLVEAKLTESDFQNCSTLMIEQYRDLDAVFERDLLPRAQIVTGRRKVSIEFPEEYSQEEVVVPAENWEPHIWPVEPETTGGYASYQLIRNVLAAYAQGASFCVIHDVRRPDLREAWFEVMRAVRDAALRVRLKVLTWQELAAVLPEDLRRFLNAKYGIVAPGEASSPIEAMITRDAC
ncbi:MAG: PGN_0703 family putative restriction endonuclease [Terracidiphilus sp.]